MKTLIANTADMAALLPIHECCEGLAAVHNIYRKAEAMGVGTWVEIGRLHFGSM
jgi:hypothetical protein